MTAWSGLFNGVYGENHALQFQRVGRHGRLINAWMRRRGNAPFRELVAALLGTAPGATATATFTAVAQPTDYYGRSGKIGVEAQTDLNRATTAADDTTLTNIFQLDNNIATPVDRSGNVIYGRPGG